MSATELGVNAFFDFVRINVIQELIFLREVYDHSIYQSWLAHRILAAELSYGPRMAASVKHFS
jgi:hypothetical protein